MIRVRIIRTVIDRNLGHLDPGKVILVSPAHAQQLIASGAALLLAETKMLDEPVVTGPPVGPLSSATRRAKSSSSLPAPPPPMPISELSEADELSASTTLGNYIRQRRSSTPAMARGGNSITQKSRRTSPASYGRKIRTQPRDFT